MNSTQWNSQEEVVWSFILAPVAIFIYGYAIYLNYALYDYQDEKPKEEKSPTDVLIKDIKSIEFLYLYFDFLIRIIALFTPPIDSDLVYFVSYVWTFLVNLIPVSWLVTLYIQYMYVFQHDQFANVNESSIRWNGFCWKIVLRILCLLLNSLVSIEWTPAPYQLLSKGRPYNR